MKKIILILFIALTMPVKAGDVDHLIRLVGVKIMLEKAYEECLKGSESLLSEELNIESQSKTLARQAKLGASCRVKVPVG